MILPHSFCFVCMKQFLWPNWVCMHHTDSDVAVHWLLCCRFISHCLSVEDRQFCKRDLIEIVAGICFSEAISTLIRSYDVWLCIAKYIHIHTHLYPYTRLVSVYHKRIFTSASVDWCRWRHRSYRVDCMSYYASEFFMYICRDNNFPSSWYVVHR